MVVTQAAAPIGNLCTAYKQLATYEEITEKGSTLHLKQSGLRQQESYIRSTSFSTVGKYPGG